MMSRAPHIIRVVFSLFQIIEIFNNFKLFNNTKY